MITPTAAPTRLSALADLIDPTPEAVRIPTAAETARVRRILATAGVRWTPQPDWYRRLRLSRYLPADPSDGGPYHPSPPQYAFLLLNDGEALYGGAAGGGKSDAALVAALQYVDVPGYAALILRRTFRDLALPDAIMARAKAWLRPHGVPWSEKDKTFTFAAGSTLTFGYLENEGDELSYQGSAYQFICFEELTQFQERQYTYLFSRRRGPTEGPLSKVPLRMRGTTNPGGPGHDWVADRFNLRPAEDGSRQQPPKRRRFIPAKLEDNPHLDRAAYEAGLDELGPVEKARLRHGDWGARPPGEMFDRSWIKTFHDAAPSDLVRIVRRWDFAATKKRRPGHDPDFTVGLKMGRRENGAVVILDVIRFQEDPGETERRFLGAPTTDGREVAIRWEIEPGANAKAYAEHLARKLIGRDAAGVTSSADKTIRFRPFASFAKMGQVEVVRASWNEAWMSELEAFPQDAVHDDQADATSGAFEDIGGLVKPAGASIQRTAEPRTGRLSDNPYHSDRRQILGRAGRRR